MDLPDFSKCVEFQRLKEKMGVITIPEVPPVNFTKEVILKVEKEVPNTKAIELDKRLKSGSVGVRLQNISVDKNGLLNIDGQKVIAYIRDQPRGIDTYHKYSKYRYHLCNCTTLVRMREIGREKRYLSTKRKDGNFEVYDIGSYRPRKLTLKLDLCQNCIRELQERGLWFNSFSLESYFQRFDSKVPKTIRRIETVTQIQTYQPSHDDLSKKYREAVKWCCQRCSVDCSDYQYLLHMHHRDGDRSNNERSNLSIFCIDCHSKEPMHEHLLFPQKAKDQVNKIKTLRRDQGIPELGIKL